MNIKQHRGTNASGSPNYKKSDTSGTAISFEHKKPTHGHALGCDLLYLHFNLQLTNTNTSFLVSSAV